jgi:hypothetical protein
MATIFNADALRKIKSDKEAAEASKAAAEEAKRAEEERKTHDAFMTREIHPEAMDRVMSAVQKAAERGDTHIMVFQFPSTFCKDSGRAINNADPTWPDTLDGFPARAYAFFEANLKQHGFRLRAEILNYPGGVPGDVGISLHW